MATVRLLDYLKALIHDPGDGNLFSDETYESFMWDIASNITAPTSTNATQFGSTNKFRYNSGADHLWNVAVSSEESGEEYEYREDSRMVINVSSGESRSEFTVTGIPVNINKLKCRVLWELANDPGKLGVYMQANGIVIDATKFADELRKASQHQEGQR